MLFIMTYHHVSFIVCLFVCLFVDEGEARSNDTIRYDRKGSTERTFVSTFLCEVSVELFSLESFV